MFGHLEPGTEVLRIVVEANNRREVPEATQAPNHTEPRLHLQARACQLNEA